MNIHKSQGYEIIQSDLVCTLASRLEPNPRGQPRKMDSKKVAKIIFLLDTKDNA
jgi:hypothetical protein